jgi:hypothetical protein
MAIPFYGDVVRYLVSLRDVYLETLAAERDADALADKEAEDECSEPAAFWGEPSTCPNVGRMCNCTGACFRVNPNLTSPSTTSPAATPAVVDEDAEVVHSVPPTVTASAFPDPGEFTAVAVREVLAEHQPNTQFPRGIYCGEATINDHTHLLPDWEGWRDHVAAEVSRRINAAAADHRVTERLDAVPDRFRRWFEPEGKK